MLVMQISKYEFRFLTLYTKLATVVWSCVLRVGKEADLWLTSRVLGSVGDSVSKNKMKNRRHLKLVSCLHRHVRMHTCTHTHTQ